MKTAQLTIDLNSVSHIHFFYRNQEGQTSAKLPRQPTVHGCRIAADEYAIPMLHEFPHETMYERAKRLDLLDTWKAVCVYQFRNNHSITFEGRLALKKRDAYNKHIYHK